MCFLFVSSWEGMADATEAASLQGKMFIGTSDCTNKGLLICFPRDVTCGLVIKMLVIIFYRFHVNCLQVMLLHVLHLS